MKRQRADPQIIRPAKAGKYTHSLALFRMHCATLTRSRSSHIHPFETRLLLAVTPAAYERVLLNGELDHNAQNIGAVLPPQVATKDSIKRFRLFTSLQRYPLYCIPHGETPWSSWKKVQSNSKYCAEEIDAKKKTLSTQQNFSWAEWSNQQDLARNNI